MSEQASNVPPQLIDLAWEAAENANVAHSALRQAETVQAQVQAVASLAIEGIVIKQKAHDTLENDIRIAQRNFDLFSTVAQPVMQMENSPLGGPKNSIQELQPRKIVRASGQARIEQREQARQRHSDFLYQALTRADENGTYEDENLTAELKETIGLSRPQWTHTLDRLRRWGCISTAIGEEGTVTKVSVDCEMVDTVISEGKISPFPDEQTAVQLREVKARQVAEIVPALGAITMSDVVSESVPSSAEAVPETHADDSQTATELSLMPVAANEAEADEVPPAAPSNREIHLPSRSELRRQSRAQYSSFIYNVLTRADKNGTYLDSNIRQVLKEAVGIEQPRWQNMIKELREWGCISTTTDESGKVNGITVDGAMVDKAIIKQRVSLFPNELTATQVLEARRSKLIADTTPAQLPEPPKEHLGGSLIGNAQPFTLEPYAAPPPLAPEMSGRVRRQIAHDQKGTSETAETPPELDEVEEDLLELRKEFKSLTKEQYKLLEPLARVALAFIDKSLLKGYKPGKLGQKLMAMTDLADEAVTEAYREMKKREFLDFTKEEDLIKPLPTMAGRRFIRNILRNPTPQP